ncbi:phage tail assembly protein T [Escherichia coli]
MGEAYWRTMLAGMTSTEYADWHRFYRTHYFHDTQLDMHFSGLTYTVRACFFAIRICIRRISVWFAPRRDDEQTEMPDEDDMLMRKAAGISGGVRFGADGKEIVTVSDDMRSSTEDEAMLMMVSEGIPGGVRYGG